MKTSILLSAIAAIQLTSAGVITPTNGPTRKPCAVAASKHCQPCQQSSTCWLTAKDNPGFPTGVCQSDMNTLTCYNGKCVFSDSDNGCGTIDDGDIDAPTARDPPANQPEFNGNAGSSGGDVSQLVDGMESGGLAGDWLGGESNEGSYFKVRV
ncbi:hypothetical protein QQS21_004760 [Conoideocrella luteorostrata]|uniref:Uncharacterized protein n=1 Tax=Conoideocrella luteorostrata TaxID=1105319 RepID=A0AAJ0CT77_9HYPO|nr:hypothetical protein QQS21_004760 [Conoideocrella luteorostrata]